MTSLAPGAELLRTERLILRRFRMEDTAAYHELLTQPSVEATLGPGPKTLEDAARNMVMCDGHWSQVGFSFLAVVERSTKALVGRVGPWFPYGWLEPEIGWAIHPRRHRRGYATEAALASGRWLLEQCPDLQRLIHLIEPRNTGSQAVVQKIGGQKTGDVHIHRIAGPLDIWATPRSAFFADR